MKKNLGGADKIVRLVVALLIVIVFFQEIVSGTLGYILLAIAAIFTVTSLLGSCPIYSIFGISSCPPKKAS
jgi:hypothetical protein